VLPKITVLRLMTGTFLGLGVYLYFLGSLALFTAGLKCARSLLSVDPEKEGPHIIPVCQNDQPFG